MDIIGISVIHKIWGLGVIESQSGDVISVHFTGMEDSQQRTKFQVPDAFRKKFLTAADNNARKCIEQLLDEYNCAACGTPTIHGSPVNGKRFCLSCRPLHTAICPCCGELHSKTAMVSVINKVYYYEPTLICSTCAESHSFVCDKCKERFLTSYKSARKIGSHLFCEDCYETVLCTCSFCGNEYRKDDGRTFYSDGTAVHICPNCIDQQTFFCKTCGQRRLKTSIAVSKFISLKDQLCSSCAVICMHCGIAVYPQDAVRIFEKMYCPDCIETKVKECSYCGEKFVPEHSEQTLCPDCIETEKYIARLQTLDFVNCSYKKIDYYSLESINRCSLFTALYKNCWGIDGKSEYSLTSEDGFRFLEMDLYRYKVLVTYLPRHIVGETKYSCNITMTEFRKHRGKSEVFESIEQWLDTADHFMETAAGEMHILIYPILLRVQTELDKVYGKTWNGPDDYIEIGNYGDTTNFYIIGILP